MRLIVIPLLFDYVYQGDARLGRAEIMLVLVALELAASGTLVLVVLRVDVAQTDRGFEVPAFTQNPRVAIRQSETRSPALITVILRGLALKRDSHATDVVERVTAVQAEEMAVIAFTEPVAELRHYHPVFDFLVLVLIQRPRVVGAREVKGRAFAQPKFQTQVGRGTRPIQ